MREKAVDRQLDLFSAVTQAYVAAPEGTLSNADLYEKLMASGAVSASELHARTPVGRSGQKHSMGKRRVRWFQQTLRACGVLERVPDSRGVWRLASDHDGPLTPAREGLSLVAFSTTLGVAIWGGCESVLAGLDQPISLCITSPPYMLRNQRAYGGPDDEIVYVDFLCRALEPIVAHLAPGGSICLNVGQDSFEPGLPSRRLHLERLVLALHDRFGLKLMDRLVWMNPSRPPGPIAWASKKRVQLNATWEPIYWFTNRPDLVNADNRRVLEAHTKRHMELMQGGGEKRSASYGDGAHRIRPASYGQVTEGRIPRNVLVRGHQCRDTRRHHADARRLGLPAHGAMFPTSLPEFLIRWLSQPNELIVDPFGGSAKTGLAAERLGRRWMVTERILEYLRTAGESFRDFEGFDMPETVERWRIAA